MRKLLYTWIIEIVVYLLPLNDRQSWFQSTAVESVIKILEISEHSEFAGDVHF